MLYKPIRQIRHLPIAAQALAQQLAKPIHQGEQEQQPQPMRLCQGKVICGEPIIDHGFIPAEWESML